MSTHNLCLERKYEKISDSYLIYSSFFRFLEVKFSMHLNSRVFAMLFLD